LLNWLRDDTPVGYVRAVSDAETKDMEARAEFERQQFLLYETRRLTTETHANAVIAATLVVTAVVLTDYGRPEDPQQRPALAWLILALLGLVVAFAFAVLAREVSWRTPRWRGGSSLGEAASASGEALVAVRSCPDGGVELRDRIHQHWRARAHSAWTLGDVKSRLVRLALWGFVGPLVYFAASLVG
jgi:hypothetical protein